MEKSQLAVAYSHFFGRFSSRCTFAKLAKYELSKVLVLGSSHYGMYAVLAKAKVRITQRL
jgi:hypothetical protein